MHRKAIQYHWLISILIITALLFAAAISRLQVDTDVAASLPPGDGVLADAVYIFKNHPLQNEIAIDIALDRTDKDFLVQVAGKVEELLRESGLFTRVGMDDMQQAIPQLIGHVTDHLPLLFSARELQDQILPLLSAQSVEDKFKELRNGLMRFESIGQAAWIARDPLAFRELKLADLSSLAPSQNVQLHKGKLLSPDGRHALILAQPSGSGTDTAFARRLSDLMSQIDSAAKALTTKSRGRITLTPVGAYRAALDNETMVRGDVQKAVILSTLGIAFLLLLAFPRPLIGLLALLPALAGTSLALFVYSLFNESISILALGFGGAIISITVDFGIAYLLFLDRPEETYGRDASREIWGIGLFAAMTTIGAFFALSLSGFLIFKELGLFSAMGIAFSFLFVHSAFPIIFPYMPPARTSRSLPVQRWADGLAGLGLKGCLAAMLVGGCLVFWAKPDFNVDLSSLNSVSDSTRSAEALFSEIWGDIFGKIYLMTEAHTAEALQEKGDRLLAELEKAQDGREIRSTFAASKFFPGVERRKANDAAWRRFWSPERVGSLRAVLMSAAVRYDFNETAFEPFFRSLESPPGLSSLPIEYRFHGLIGMSQSLKGDTWRQVTTIVPGDQYDGERLYSRLSTLSRVFDARLFSNRMGRVLFKTFTRMLLITGSCVILLLLIFFADWKLTLISLLPLAFALVSTLGSLRLMGRSIDIPSLMLGNIVLGMGIDYSLFFVGAYQRYRTFAHPNFRLIRMSIFIASLTTLTGFGVLCTATHTLLQSAGISSFLGIGFSMVGAFIILPPILERRFASRAAHTGFPGNENSAVMARYRDLEPYPRFFARFKLRLDPMFQEIGSILPPKDASIRTILDIGTGYGIPACWLVQHYPGARVYGIEPEYDRVRVANYALGGDGKVVQGLAPQIPEAPHGADAAFMLDMCHLFDENAFNLTLARLHETLREEGFVIIRVVLEPHRPLPWTWWLENLKMKLHGSQSHYRSLSEIVRIVKANRFEILKTQCSGKKGELAWVVARR